MISAKEAREKVIECNNEAAKKQLEKLEKIILRTIDDNNLMCVIEGSLFTSVEDKLKELGYDVNTKSARNETWTTIKW